MLYIQPNLIKFSLTYKPIKEANTQSRKSTHEQRYNSDLVVNMEVKYNNNRISAFEVNNNETIDRIE